MARRSRTYIDRPIHTIKDWFGVDWDVYVERKTQAGVMLCEGWPYSLRPKDGIGGRFSHILTLELAEYLKVTRTGVATQQLGISNQQMTKFKNWMGIQNKVIHRNDEWLLAHQDEILYSSFNSLKEKYGLTRTQVYNHKAWLEDLIGVQAGRLRHTEQNDAHEQWYQKHHTELQSMQVEDIVTQFQISKFMALGIYNRIQQERQGLSYSAQLQVKKQQQQQWLLDHQEVILSNEYTIEQIAQKLNKKTKQILMARTALRQNLNIATAQEQSRAWILQHQEDFLNLSYAELAKKYQLTKHQVSNRKQKLKKLLNLPKFTETLQQWRMQHKDLILSNQLSIAEIAQRLHQSTSNIHRIRTLLRTQLKLDANNQPLINNEENKK